MGRVELLPPVYRTSIKIFTEQKKVNDGDEIKVDNFFHYKRVSVKVAISLKLWEILNNYCCHHIKIK